jgi:hypothetical protein
MCGDEVSTIATSERHLAFSSFMKAIIKATHALVQVY